MRKSTSVIPVLWPRKDKNGLYPIKIRITENRKSSYVAVDVSIKKTDWSDHKRLVKTSNPDCQLINDRIVSMTEELESSNLPTAPKKSKDGFFLDYLQLKIGQKREGNKFFSTKRYQSLYYHLLKFTNNQPIYFTDINKDFVVRFTTYLEKNIKSRTDRGEASVNTVVNYLKVFKTILNHAIKDEVITGVNPIPSHLIPSKKKIKKVPLNTRQIWKLNEIKPNDPKLTKGMYDALNVFMFSFWSRGLRISDVLHLKYKHFTNGYFTVVMEKTEEIVYIPLTINNVERIMPYLLDIHPVFDWDRKKFIRFSPEVGEDEQFIYSNSKEELFNLHSSYLGSLRDLHVLLKDRVDFYNNKVKFENRKKIYFHEDFEFDSREMMKFFKKSEDIEEKMVYSNYLRDREIYLEFCKKFFYKFCLDIKRADKAEEYVFPFLRGHSHLRGFQMGQKISSATALINKNLYKISERFEIPKFTTHFARHTFTSTSKMMGVDIYDLRNWLGHTSVKNTEVYVNTLEDPKDDMHSLRLYEMLNS